MIGIFDSGVGGLSIYQQIKKLYPKAKILYLADKKNFPYGHKTEAELEAICEKNIDFLLQKGAKLIVVACNSATVSTIKVLRSTYPTPIIGIEPAVKMAAQSSVSGRIGLMATSRTVASHDGEKWLKNGQKLFKSHQDSLVELIENEYEAITEKILTDSLTELVKKEVDCIALGCTHYHFLNARYKVLFPRLIFLSPEESVARRVKDIVDEEEIKLENGSDIFFSSKDKKSLEKFIFKVLKLENADVREV